MCEEVAQAARGNSIFAARMAAESFGDHRIHLLRGVEG
jgi:hypothetical protein